MKKFIVGMIAIFTLLFVIGCSQSLTSKVVDAPVKESEQEMASSVKEFNMVARQWDFEPSTITVSEGDTVLLHIQSVDVGHGFGLSAFGINEYLPSGQTVDVEFVADQKGTFTFACSVSCGSGHSSMRGQLIVE